MKINEKIQLIVGLAFILAVVAILYPKWEGISNLYQGWLPSILIGVTTTAVSGALVKRVTNGALDDLKIMIFGFGLPVSLVLTFAVKIIFF